MASVNGVASVDVCADGVTLAGILAEYLSFMGAGVGSQDGIFVNVVCIRAVSAGMVFGEAEGIEVLGYGDNGGETVVVGECRGREAGFEEFAG